MLIKAPFIITMTGDVITDGAIRTEQDRIVEVGTTVKATAADPTVKLDNLILLPGLVNAHGHIDLSFMSGQTSQPKSFTSWIEEVVSHKTGADEKKIAEGLRNGLQQYYRSGITCIGEHVSFPSAVPFIIQMPIRGRIFIEVAGPMEQKANENLEAALRTAEKYAVVARNKTVSPTPHSPYALHPSVLKKMLVSFAHNRIETGSREAPLSIHCAENMEEWQCFTRCAGPLADFVTSHGLPLTSTSRSPVEYIERNGGLPKNGILVHANYLDDDDIDGMRSAGIAIVHCPQSARYFGHTKFPMERVAGIPVALGTDSLITAPRLSLLKEMQLVKETWPAISPRDILAMATVNGARALGMGDVCGTLAPGMKADMIAVRIVDGCSNPYENVLFNEEVPFVVIDGRIVRNDLSIPSRIR